MSNFIDRCLSGEVLLEDIDDFVAEWHMSDVGAPIHDYLGMTQEEYFLWVEDPKVLPDIVNSRHYAVPIADLAAMHNTVSMAARSDDGGNPRDLIEWIEHSGLSD